MFISNSDKHEINYQALANAPLSDENVQLFLNRLDADFELEENSSYKFYKYTNGIELQCTVTDTIIGIVFIFDEIDEDLELPYGIKKEYTREDIESLIGKPDKFCMHKTISKAYYMSKRMKICYETVDYNDSNARIVTILLERGLENKRFNPYRCK